MWLVDTMELYRSTVHWNIETVSLQGLVRSVNKTMTLGQYDVERGQYKVQCGQYKGQRVQYEVQLGQCMLPTLFRGP